MILLSCNNTAQNTVPFLSRDNITLAIAVLGAVISLCNSASGFLHSRQNFRIHIIKITHVGEFLVAYLCLENKSRLPISITSLSTIIGGKKYSGFSIPPHTFKSVFYENDVRVSYRECQTMIFPINLGSLSGASGYISFDISEEACKSLSKHLNIVVSTNRGRLKKMKLRLPEWTPWKDIL